MLFSNLVATIRADLDAIRDDLGEFVETVKTDASAVLGLAQEEGENKNGGTQGGKYLPWEEELWNHPELLCENPLEEDEWEKVVQQSMKDEEIEALLSSSETVHELYKELVPSKATHSDFFQRLFYHRTRLNEAARLRMKELVEDEEETRWEDDSLDEIPAQKETPVTPEQQNNVAVEQVNAKLVAELEDCKQEMKKMLAKITELEVALKQSEIKRAELEAERNIEVELPHKKAPLPVDVLIKEAFSTPTKPDEGEEVTPTMPKVPSSSASWEALASATVSNTSSNDEVVVDLKHEEEDEDDWE
jgi:hypothetical protein